MEALMALDAVHVLGNHDRWLIDRPVEKMGSWDRAAYAQLGVEHFDWLRTVPSTQIFRDQVFLCHATPADDNVYWLETVTPDGAVKLSPLEAIEKEAEGISQSLILCAIPISRARCDSATDAWWSIPEASAFPAFPTTFRSRI